MEDLKEFLLMSEHSQTMSSFGEVDSYLRIGKDSPQVKLLHRMFL
jgi:hypothetical protein